jgi:hypothetical protein
LLELRVWGWGWIWNRMRCAGWRKRKMKNPAAARGGRGS